MTTTLAVKGDVQLKAGSAAATLTDAQYNNLINQAEAFVCTQSKFNWIDVYATLNATIKQILTDAVSSHAAMAVINYDMSGFSSRVEAQVMLDVNYTRLVDTINLLRDDKFRTFVEEELI